MKFTDEDLKRYKELAEKCHPLTCDLTLALITRLEAAETYGRYMRTKHPGWYNPQYEKWRKAKGEPK